MYVLNQGALGRKGHPFQQPLLQKHQHSGQREQFGCGEPSPNPLIIGKLVVEPRLV